MNIETIFLFSYNLINSFQLDWIITLKNNMYVEYFNLKKKNIGIIISNFNQRRWSIQEILRQRNEIIP